MQRAKSGWSARCVLGGTVAAAAAMGHGCTARSARYNPSYAQYPYGGGGAYAPGTSYAPASSGIGPIATPGAPNTPVPSTAGGSTGALLQAADRALRAQGYQPVGNAQRTFTENDSSSFQMGTQPGSCYTAFALGDTGAQDVDLAVIAPSGQSVGEDRATDAHPTVSFCPTEYGPHLARVNMFHGNGNVFFMLYQGPAGTSPNIAQAWSGSSAATPAQAGLVRVQGGPDPVTAQRVQALQAQLGSQGYQPASQPALSGYQMHANQTESWPVNLVQGTCYTFATLGGPGVSDTDVFVFDAAGRQQLAGDGGSSVDAVVRDFCPTTTGTYQLRPRLYAGNGALWFLAMARPNAAAGTPPTSTPPPTLAINTNASSSGGLDSTFNAFEREIVSRGYETTGNAVTHTLQTNATQPENFALEANHCYAIAAVGDSSVQDLSMTLLDPQGAEIDRYRGQDARPNLRVCPTASGQFTARMQMAAGSGAYRLRLFRWRGGTSGAGMTGLLFVRNAEVTRILQADNYQGDADFEIYRGRIRQGAAATQRTVSLRANSCYAFMAVGGTGVSDLNLALLQSRRQIATDNARSAFPQVRYCTQAAGNYQVAIRSAAGTGEFVFRVFKQQARGGGP